MSNAIVIFSTIILNICEPQICFETQKYSYLSNGFNEIILDSCEANVDQDRFKTNRYFYEVSSSPDECEPSQESVCNMNSVEETYNESESEEKTDEKKKGDDTGFILTVILILVFICAADNGGRRNYR
ncbi:PREDICTED: uncharacterized protein LOC108976009 [Bactrocera latifrons]|uniref:uncharacterized protein LOC108976009 n=1 Tax=Bactrocera latifrons TaxID=174628 RepID=UPI0008DCAD4C|nr:PREDICTED: uncharacterized protein LOC108976009 [Bactrocera latifrons]